MPFTEAFQNRTSLFKLPQGGTMEPDRRATGRGWFRALFVVAVTVLLTLTVAGAVVLTLTVVAVPPTVAAVVAFLTPAVAAVILTCSAVAFNLTGSFLHLLQYPFAPAQPLPGLGRKQRCDPYQ